MLPQKRGASVLVSNRKVRGGYNLVDLSKTQEHQRNSVLVKLEKHSKLLRYFFESFNGDSGAGRNKPPPKGIAVNEKVILIAELMKLYREHNINGAMLSKSEYEMLINLINDKLLKPYDDEALNFTGFTQFFWQSAIYCH